MTYIEYFDWLIKTYSLVSVIRDPPGGASVLEPCESKVIGKKRRGEEKKATRRGNEPLDSRRETAAN